MSIRLGISSATKLLVGVGVAACTLAAMPSEARADDKDCPPGSWFCGDTKPPPPPSEKTEPAPADQKPADAKPSTPPPPPVVVYQAPGAVVVQPREAPPAYYYVPRNPPPKREWGLNLHIGGLMMGKGKEDDAGMGLIGLGLRYRPVPVFAVEADLDFAGGRDYNGYRRNETALSFNGLVFVNPKNKAQVYFLAGFGWAGARAVDDRNGFDSVEYKYGYFGAQTGVGLEFRLSKTVALNLDLRGFIRGRIDDNRHEYPEFTDSNGRSTNTSGGGLFQGGLTFYW